MASDDRKRWNFRYQRKNTIPEIRPIVQRFFHLAKSGGRVLDLAAGLGVNALFLARQGFTVFAVDISDSALLPLAGRHPRLCPVCLDLDTWDIPTGYFDLILNIRFLNRRLFPQIMEGLAPGGVLIAETYILPYTNAASQPAAPRNSDYFLRPNELLRAFLPLHLVYYNEELQPQDGNKGPSAGLVGIKPHPNR